MKIYLCWYHDWENDQVCKLYFDMTSVNIWMNQCKEVEKKYDSDKLNDLNIKLIDGAGLAGRYDYEEREVL